jgi:hypothetical protein
LRILFAIDIHGNKHAFGDGERAAIGFQRTEEATAVTFVADSGTEGFDEKEQGIGIAIDANFANAQDVATGFAFLPKAIAGTRKKMDFAGLLGFFQGFGVEIAEHEDVTGFVILHDAWNQAAKFFKRKFHKSSIKTKNPPGGSRQRAE